MLDQLLLLLLLELLLSLKLLLLLLLLEELVVMLQHELRDRGVGGSLRLNHLWGSHGQLGRLVWDRGSDHWSRLLRKLRLRLLQGWLGHDGYGGGGD